MKETTYKTLITTNNNTIVKLVTYKVILYMLNIGVPKQNIRYILGYANKVAKPRFFKDLLQMEKDYYKSVNPSCAICGSNENLTIHHIKPVSKCYWLKYDINNFNFNPNIV